MAEDQRDALRRLGGGFELTPLSDGSAVLVDRATLEAVVVSDVGRTILERLRQGERDLDRIAADVAAAYDVPLADARRDAEAFLTDLDRRLGSCAQEGLPLEYIEPLQ